MSEKKIARPALLVINEPYAMRINQELAKEIGFENSIVLLQLEFLIRTSSDSNYKANRWWTYQSLKNLHSQFPWWSLSTLSRIIKDLVTKKLLMIDNFNKMGTDRTHWFTLNEEGLSTLKSVTFIHNPIKMSILQNEKCNSQNDKCIIPNCKMHVVKLKNACSQIETTLPETSSETTTETTSEKEKNIHVSHSLDVVTVPSQEIKLSKFHSEIEEVFNYWKKVFDKRINCLLAKGDKYWKAIEGRLKEGFTVSDLKEAIQGCSLSPFHMGIGDDGSSTGKKFNCITLICRDKIKVDNFLTIYHEKNSPSALALAVRPQTKAAVTKNNRAAETQQNIDDVFAELRDQLIPKEQGK